MIVALLGLVISLFAYLISFPAAHHRRFDIYAALFALHILAAVTYWLLTFEGSMDAFLYYRDPYGFFQKSALTSGTHFIVHLVQNIKVTLGGSFFDHFLLFQCFGMIAVALIMRCFAEIAESFGSTVPLPVYATLFLPGFHFWSTAIGKDGPMIMAISLTLWAALRIHKRIFWIGLAIFIMALIRPHIAAMVMTGIAGALLLSRQLDWRVRIALAPIALIGLIVALGQATDRFGITLDPGSVSEFIETQQEHGERYGSGANLATQPLPLKIWALLFRPFFYDAEGLMFWAASVENAMLLLLFTYVVWHWRLLLRLARHVFYLMYSLIFSTLLILGLSLVNFNIGLGQRQKMMVIPALLLIVATIYLYKRYLRTAAAQPTVELVSEQPGQPAPANV